MFAVAGIAVLPGYVNAEETQQTPPAEGGNGTIPAANTAGENSYGQWANPSPDDNLVAGPGKQTLTGSAILDTIRNAINWILGILATIALIVCLYGGFLMVTAAGDEKKYQKWLSVLKYAAIGLAIVGLSWMIVSVIFWFVGNLSWTNQTKSTGDQTVTTDYESTSLRPEEAGTTTPTVTQ